MFKSSGDTARTGKLIVTVAAVAVDPTGLAAVGAGLDAFLHAHDEMAKRHPDLAKLSKETQREFDEALKSERFDKPADARVLLPQMLERVAPATDDFVQHGLDPEPILDDLVKRLKHPDHTRPEIVSAFRDLYEPLLQDVCDDPRLKAALEPALERERVRREKRREDVQRQMLELVRELAGKDAGGVATEHETLAARLATEVETLRERLQVSERLAVAIAYRYTEDDPEDLEGALQGIKAALELAAKEQARGALASNLGDTVDDILRRVDALNDKGSVDEADDALEEDLRRRRAERERRLAEDARILEKAIAQASYTRNAERLAERTLELVRLDAPSAEDQFHRLRSVGLEQQREGQRRGTPFALEAAIGLYRKCQGVAPNAYLRAMAENDLGAALQTQGTRTGGEEGTRLLAAAVATYRDALSVRTREAHPVEWAMTRNNLGVALAEQGTRTGGAEGTRLLAEAVAAWRDALTVRTRADHPVDWAATQNNLGNALVDQGTRTGGAEGTGLLSEAVAAYRDALTVRTRADHPVDWAMTQNNLGAALADQGARTGGAEGNRLLDEAVAAYRDALTVRTREAHPVDWAMTRENMAIAEQAIADHDATGDPRPHLEAALGHVEAALEVFDPEHMAYNHEKASALRDRLKARLAAG